MSEILDFYQQRAKAGLSTLPWLAQLQTKALMDLNRRGFPTRHDEDWKYTSVEALLNQPFMRFNTADNLKESAAAACTDDINSDLPINQYMLIRNGFISGVEQLAKTLPKGVLVLPLAVALTQHPELLKPYLGTVLKQEHGFHYLNTAMIHCGVLIYIPSGIVLEEPIALTHVQTQTNQAVYLRHLIVAEENSQAVIIEDYQGLADCCYLTNTVTEIVVGAGDKINALYSAKRE